MDRNLHRLSAIFKLHKILQDCYTRIMTLKCSNACKACAACTNLTGWT